MFFGHRIVPGTGLPVSEVVASSGLLHISTVSLCEGASSAALFVQPHGGQQRYALVRLSAEEPLAKLSLSFDTGVSQCTLEVEEGSVDLVGCLEGKNRNANDEAKKATSAGSVDDVPKDAPKKPPSEKAELSKSSERKGDMVKNGSTKPEAKKEITGKMDAKSDQPGGKLDTPKKSDSKKDGEQQQQQKDFVPSKRWAGAKVGMVFKKGPKGLGYYKDTYIPPKGIKRKGSEPPVAQGPPAKKFMTLPGGLRYEVIKAAPNGAKAARGRSVQVRYEGRLAANGRRFDKGSIKFRLGAGEVIKGWDLGVNGMAIGEKRKLLIPASLGYGSRGAPPDIPRNADLTFDVELLKVV